MTICTTASAFIVAIAKGETEPMEGGDDESGGGPVGDGEYQEWINDRNAQKD